MVGARRLSIVWGHEPQYWTWTDQKLLPESRFAQVAELKYVWWFDVKGRPIELSVYLEGRESETRRNKKVVLDPQRNSMPRPYQLRGDGWMEIEMGEFFNEHGADRVVVCSLFDFDRFSPKGGLIVEGIQLRPKN
ncbi:hypothetical protein Q3G72_022638 [Acer saccharum]|nr:hypothetical protein Q3G72_022638 [Acer saccharum]